MDGHTIHYFPRTFPFISLTHPASPWSPPCFSLSIALLLPFLWVFYIQPVYWIKEAFSLFVLIVISLSPSPRFNTLNPSLPLKSASLMHFFSPFVFQLQFLHLSFPLSFMFFLYFLHYFSLSLLPSHSLPLSLPLSLCVSRSCSLACLGDNLWLGWCKPDILLTVASVPVGWLTAHEMLLVFVFWRHN
jgi:hypothetical protein